MAIEMWVEGIVRHSTGNTTDQSVKLGLHPTTNRRLVRLNTEGHIQAPVGILLLIIRNSACGEVKSPRLVDHSAALDNLNIHWRYEGMPAHVCNW
jgi:hypothetical protein